MLSKWASSVWLFLADYTSRNDAWSLFVSGILAAGITLPADGQPNRVWVLATLVILFNVAVNAIRRAKTVTTPSIKLGANVPITTVPATTVSSNVNPDYAFNLINAIEAAIATYKATATTSPVLTNIPFNTSTVVSPNQNITFPSAAGPTTPTVVSPPENASEAAARAAIATDITADANEASALAALTPAEAAVVTANTVTTV